MGEVTAAVVAGALTPAEGLRVIATRSALMARLSGQGAMALLELDAESAEALIADHPDVTIAVYASPRQTVIAGPPELVDRIVAAVAAQNRLARRIEVDVASHHPTIDPILDELRSALSGLAPKPPTIPILSTVDGIAAPAFDAHHWVANLRHPVRFAQTVAAAGARHATFVEISPHPLLTHAISDTVDAARVLSAMNRDQDQTLFFHARLAALGTLDPAAGRLADLPHPSWRHKSFWVADRSGTAELTSSHPLLGSHMELPSGRDHVWQADIGTDVCGWLADHKVGGQPILIDEVLTPDSSRFWPEAEYEPGHGQPSFDKQFVRDYLEEIRWNKQPPVPSLPDDVVRKTREKYVEAYRLISGRELQ